MKLNPESRKLIDIEMGNPLHELGNRDDYEYDPESITTNTALQRLISRMRNVMDLCRGDDPSLLSILQREDSKR